MTLLVGWTQTKIKPPMRPHIHVAARGRYNRQILPDACRIITRNFWHWMTCFKIENASQPIASSRVDVHYPMVLIHVDVHL